MVPKSTIVRFIVFLLSPLGPWYKRYDVTTPDVGANVEQPLVSNADAVARGGFWDTTLRPFASPIAYENDDAQPIVGVRCANDCQ
jgi:hypothetical protein